MLTFACELCVPRVECSARVPLYTSWHDNILEPGYDFRPLARHPIRLVVEIKSSSVGRAVAAVGIVTFGKSSTTSFLSSGSGINRTIMDTLLCRRGRYVCISAAKLCATERPKCAGKQTYICLLDNGRMLRWNGYRARYLELPGSNVGLETGKPDRMFVVLLSPTRWNIAD